jgi:dipeptide/tripeptide permease
MTALILYLLGKLWRPGLLVVGLLALVLACGRLIRPDNVAIGGFKVPREWEAWGRGRYLSVFGFLLGMGVITTMPSPVMLVLVAWVWNVDSLAWASITFGIFAVGRLIGTIATVLGQGRAQGDVAKAADMVIERMSYLARLEALVTIALGVVVIVSM